MKRTLLIAVILLVGLTAAYGYRQTRQEARFRQLINLGDDGLAKGDAFAAVGTFSEAIALNPDSMLGYLKRGEAHRQRGDLDAAAADLTRAHALDPAAPRVLELLGDVEAGRDAHGKAAAHYAGAVRLDDRPRVLYKLGLSSYIAGQLDDAVGAVTEAIARDSRFAEAHYLLGLCLSELDNPHEAEQALTRALALAPALHAAREQLADLYGATGRHGARIAELERLLSADAGPARQITLALAYSSRGQTPRAVRLLTSMLERYPNHVGAHIALGRIWVDASEGGTDFVALLKAIDALEHAVSLDASGTSLAELAHARLQAGDPAGAFQTLQLAAERFPVDPTVFLRLAEAWERGGDTRAARRALIDHQALLTNAQRQRLIALRIADLSMELREPAIAADWYSAAEDETRVSAALLIKLAEARAQAGEIEAARKTIARVLEHDPGNAAAQTLERSLR